MIELVNDSYRLKDDLYGDPEGEAALRFAAETAASLIFPFAPHLGSEAYDTLDRRPGSGSSRGRSADESLLDPRRVHARRPGKRQAPRPDHRRIGHARGASCCELARTSENVVRHLDGKEIVKEIVVPGKLVNLVVR